MQKKYNIFLICGKAESGKNLVAKFISDYYKDKNIVITSYSKYIKLYAKELSNWDGLDENKPRTLLQNIGSLVRDNIHYKDFFVKRMLEDIKVYQYYNNDVIISDVRLPNEIEDIKNTFNNVYAIKVNKENNSLNDKQKNHITELALDDYEEFDYVINNNSSLENLKQVVYSILDKLI